MAPVFPSRFSSSFTIIPMAVDTCFAGDLRAIPLDRLSNVLSKGGWHRHLAPNHSFCHRRSFHPISLSMRSRDVAASCHVRPLGNSDKTAPDQTTIWKRVSLNHIESNCIGAAIATARGKNNRQTQSLLRMCAYTHRLSNRAETVGRSPVLSKLRSQ